MYTLGHDSCRRAFMPGADLPAAIRRWFRNSSSEKLLEAVAVPQVCHLRGRRPVRPRRRRRPAPESCHAIRAAIDEALRCKATGEAKTILFCLTGHGHFDIASYDESSPGS